MVKYKVTLTETEHVELMDIINKGYHTSQKFRAAYILVNCDEGKHAEKVTNEQISKVLKIGMKLHSVHFLQSLLRHLSLPPRARFVLRGQKRSLKAFRMKPCAKKRWLT